MIKYIWQLPQNIIGFIITRFLKYDGECYRWNLKGSISLGEYIILSNTASQFTLRHEKGHQKQSLILGWLYLLVIGVPSFLWAFLRRCGLFRNIDYYAFYTEAWANSFT